MNSEIKKAANLLSHGNVVAIPTETVYGLAANAFDEKAVAKIFEIKGRPIYNPLIVHIKAIEYLDIIAENIPHKAYQLAKKFWPGPLTLVLPKKNNIPSIVTANKNTVGIRIPSHPIALELLNEIDFPIAAPSANPFGYISPTTSFHVQKQLGAKIPYILDGGMCEKGIESTIIGFEDGEPILYRLGSLSLESIENYIGKVKIKFDTDSLPEAPGMLKKHYSPNTKFRITENIYSCLIEEKDKNIGFLIFSNLEIEVHEKCILLSKNQNLKEAAQNLYAAMQELDNMGFDLIIAEKFPNIGIGKALNDKLLRAQEDFF